MPPLVSLGTEKYCPFCGANLLQLKGGYKEAIEYDKAIEIDPKDYYCMV
jgi:hypothetical protein